jgi:hypothetical protein
MEELPTIKRQSTRLIVATRNCPMSCRQQAGAERLLRKETGSKLPYSKGGCDPQNESGEDSYEKSKREDMGAVVLLCDPCLQQPWFHSGNRSCRFTAEATQA